MGYQPAGSRVPTIGSLYLNLFLMKQDFHETSFASKSLTKVSRHAQFLFLISQRIRKKVEKSSTSSRRNISQHLITSHSMVNLLDL